MTLIEEIGALPGDLREAPDAALAFGLSVGFLAFLPVAIYGGNIVAAGAMAVGGLAALTKADAELEEAT